MDLVGGQGGTGIRPSCSGRGLGGQGSAPGFLHSPWGGGGGLGTRIGVCSPPCFLLLSAYPTSPPGPLGGPQAQLPYLGAFSPARSHHAPSGSQAPSLPPGALWGPLFSPSTSALSLVLSHGDRRKESQRALAGPHRMPTKALGGGSGLALSSPERRGRASPVGLGTHLAPPESRSGSSSTRQAESHRDWLGAGVGHAPLLFSPVAAGSDCCDQPCFKHVLT
ncbi:hypothetical protein GH733_011761, partial [Mirounga leonina]